MEATNSPAAPDPPRFLTVAQAATYLGVTDSTIYRLCEARKLAHRKIGAGAGRIRFTHADLDAYLSSTVVPVRSAGEDLPPTGVRIASDWFPELAATRRRRA